MRRTNVTRTCPAGRGEMGADPRRLDMRRMRCGFAYLMAMVLLIVMVVMAVSFTGLTTMNVLKSDNQRDAVDARLAAESGLEFMLDNIRRMRLPGRLTQETFVDSLCTELSRRLDATGNLAGQSVTKTADAVLVPPISLEGMTFRSCVRWVDANRCRLEVTGAAHGLSRRVTMDLMLVSRRPGVFDYGLASRGQVTVSGNAKIVGVNQPTEASVLSATQSSSEAISVNGSVVISGDLFAAGQNTTVGISGRPEIAGSQDPAVIAQHVHLGVEAPDFPELDAAPLAALATNLVDRTTDLKQSVLKNIRIAAGTNPTFSSDVVINGVIYVEAPNIVRFEGKTTLNGFIVTQDSDQPLSSCQIHFAGHVEARGVEGLPATPEYAAVKQQTGTFMLAPGFGATFAGSFSAINGSIAADQLTFTGTAEGVVKGSVIGMKDLPTEIGGTVEIYVDSKNADPRPAGFVQSTALTPDPSTYAEAAAGG